MLRGKLELGGLFERVGRERIFVTVKSAVRAFEQEISGRAKRSGEAAASEGA